ncbi:hypothetical protein Tco_0969302 [Tanacetum coccineum]
MWRIRIFIGYVLLYLDIGIGHQMELGVGKMERKEIFCSFVYAHNKYNQRRSLWRNLSKHKVYIHGRPWCILGDFNAALFMDDSTASGSNVDIAMREFRDCIEDIEVLDVQCTGLQYTWNQNPKGMNGMLKKLDRVMANIEFYDHFVGTHAIFKPYLISDHSPSVLCIPTLSRVKPRPFKFFNILTTHEKFLDVVRELGAAGNLHANVSRVRAELDSIQTLLDADPFNAMLREREASCVVEFNEAVLLEERFLKQKAKIQWIKDGDSNSAYFHKAVKSHTSRSRIDAVTNSEGVVFENDMVPNAFVVHYESFLGLAGETHGFNVINLFNSCLNEQEANDMVRNVTAQEVKEAFFSIGDDKSPGPDGFSAAFFKEAWNVVANDVTNAICEFFRNGTLLKELNHTIIALIPKVKNPTRVVDYRPISCCNVLFKCINLMHNYHLDRGTPRCAFKVDIQKAYDTVDWNFLCLVLHGFGFHERMIAWIMECVTSTSYSICVDGSLHGYFQGKRGLRQGDPLSPYLFTLVMEVLTLMIKRNVQESYLFTYHRFCSKMELINLCFTDDLFLFAYGDVQSASVIKEALDEFKQASGLIPSLPKSTAYFCNVLNHVKLSILQVLPFEEGKLPVKYLGVPLVSSRLMIRDCNELIDRVQIRIQDWKNKSLSIAGRLQLIQSVLGSMHIYWASVFILPSRVLLNIEQLMRNFLWCHGNGGKGKSKVAWEVVCLPKVKWIHEYKLNGHNFWDIPLRGNMSWGWRKILKLRPLIREFIWHKIGNSAATSLCLNLHSKVKEVILNGSWLWPPYLLAKYPFLSECHVPLLDDTPDSLVWRNSQGRIKRFSVTQVSSDIRNRDSKVNWMKVLAGMESFPLNVYDVISDLMPIAS